jgi:serine/threonine protein kinase/tetratricopeptide (TPR) repeat protein
MIGETILHYKIISKLGQGGMGIVYKAEDLKLGRTVALKFLPHKNTQDEQSLERLLNEARSASALNHQNVCTIYSIEEFQNENITQPDQFIVMEFVSGTTLRKKNEEGPQKIIESIKYALQIAEALKESHSKGIAHLDIKSDNIMINSKNQVKVMDFGLAKLRGPTSEPRYESTYGTAAYMSPEQAIGKPAGLLSDIWSFGVVLYEMVTGKLPFIHNYDAAIIYSILNEDPLPPSEIRPDIPKGLEDIILKCIQKEEINRYQNADQITAELVKIKNNVELESGRVSSGKRDKKEVKKETEQKQAAIVYMLIENYSDLLDLIGSENIVGILEKCYEIINHVTQKFNGTVSKTEENNIVLYFGLPTTIEDSSGKALSAAIEISNQLTHLSRDEKLPVKLILKAAVNTGLVIAGNISSGQKLDYTVIGDTVEIVSKMLEAAPAGQILAGPLTFRYTKNNFQFKFFETLSLRGKRDPVKIYLLESFNLIDDKKIKDSDRVIHSDLVGRKEELDKLEYLLLKAINGEGSIVSIIAEAGIGKSRLISEFKKKEIFQRVNLLEGKALSTQRNVSFYPIISILKQWAQINENDNESQAFSKLEHSISSRFDEEANEIVPFIATLMGFNLTGEYEKRVNEVSSEALSKLIQKSMRNLILKGSQLKPVIFIVEDIHWADLSSIELLQSLLRLAENNKILFVSTMRPDFPETGDKIISTIKDKYSAFYSEMKLKPLNHEDCQILLQNLLKIQDLPIQLRNSISKSTEGNPFFIEEVIRSLVDDKIILINNNKFQISETAEKIVIPGTIKEVLLSRIDKLDESTKNVLKAASVIGRYFLYDILLKVMQDAENVDSGIQSLLKLELIKENENAKDREFLFIHALVQEAVYETLLSKNKQEIHAKVAKAIEVLYAGRIHEFYEMLAHHYSLADDKENAEKYLVLAGERTLKNAASNEALVYFKEALKLYLQKYGKDADKEKIFMFEKNIGISLYNRGYFIESVEHFSKALNTVGIKLNRSALSEFSRLASNFLLILKHLYLPSKKQKRPPSQKDYLLFDLLFKVATAYANYNGKKLFFELINLIKMKMDFALNGEDGFSTYSMAGALFAYGGISFLLSRKFLERANSYAKLNGIDDVYNMGYDETIYYCLSGNWKHFSKINEKLLELKLRAGDLVYIIYQISWALYMIICRGEYEYAEYLINKGDEISETYDFDYGKLYILSFKSDLNLNRRNLHKAISYFTESCELAEKLGLSPWIIGLSGKRAKAYILLNDFESAKISLEKAENALKEADSLTPMLLSYYMAVKLFYLIRIYEKEMKGSVPKEKLISIEKEIKKSIKSAVKVSNKVAEIKPEVDRLRANYYLLKNNSKKAIKYFQKSIDYAKHLDAFPELGRSYLEFGKFLFNSPAPFKDKSPEYYFSEAHKIFERLNLKWDLDELKRLKNLAGGRTSLSNSSVL